MPFTRKDITQTEISTIPNFDGNPIILPLFVESCEELLQTYYDVVNPNNTINTFLIRIINHKFVGEAQNLIASRELQTWRDIKACF